MLDEVEAEVSSPRNLRLHVEGTLNATLEWRNWVTVQTLYIVKNQTTHLLGLPVIEDLGVVQLLKLTESILSTQTKIFHGLGQVQAEYHTRLSPDACPFSMSVPRQIPLPLLKHVKKELDDMETKGVIRKATRQPHGVRALSLCRSRQAGTGSVST